MSSQASIVCFANSRKLSGRCVAGLRWDGMRCSKWIRPVSTLAHGELTYEYLYSNGCDPQLLDIVQLRLLNAKVKGCHVEDIVVDPKQTWVKVGRLTFDQVLPYVPKPIGPLWFNGSSTYHGENDSIPANEADKLTNSLMLIQPKKLTLACTDEGYRGQSKKRVRGEFASGRYSYKFSVTDPVIEAEFAGCDVGEHRELDEPILCLSVGERFDQQNAHYKLIAGVIERANG